MQSAAMLAFISAGTHSDSDMAYDPSSDDPQSHSTRRAVASTPAQVALPPNYPKRYVSAICDEQRIPNCAPRLFYHELLASRNHR